MKFGNKIAKIRKDNKMSQEDLAQMFHVTRQTVSSWENSKSYPDIETIIKISDRFNISLDILLKEDKEMINNIDKKIKATKPKNIIITISIILISLLLLILGINSYNNYVDKYNYDIANKYTNYEEILDFYYNNELYEFQIKYDLQGKTWEVPKIYELPIKNISQISGNKEILDKLDIDLNDYIGKKERAFKDDLLYKLYEILEVNGFQGTPHYETLGEKNNLKPKKYVGWWHKQTLDLND